MILAGAIIGYGSVFICGIILIIAGGIAYFALAGRKKKEPRYDVGLVSP